MREALFRAGVPCVFFDRYYEGAAPKAAADNVESGRRMAEYLLGCGHRKIGILTGPLSLNSSRGRLEGVKAFEAHGLGLSENTSQRADTTSKRGRRAQSGCLKRTRRRFLRSAICRLTVYRAARKRAFHSARYLRGGFDDAVYSALLETPLTTMRQPVGELASAACRAALGLIRGESVPASFSLPAELIVRGSVGRIN
ncbi:MAG: substrate-binding domain-containing protein [Christensenellaceae bacterium]